MIPGSIIIAKTHIDLPSMLATIDGVPVQVDMIYEVKVGRKYDIINVSSVPDALNQVTWFARIPTTEHDSLNMYDFLRQVAINGAPGDVTIKGSYFDNITVRFRLNTVLNLAKRSCETTVVELNLTRIRPGGIAGAAASQK
jgi:uncharacterized membrane protein